MRPCWQRCIHQAANRIQVGEIDCRAGIVQIREENPQAVWQRLLTSHAGYGLDGDSR